MKLRPNVEEILPWRYYFFKFYILIHLNFFFLFCNEQIYELSHHHNFRLNIFSWIAMNEIKNSRKSLGNNYTQKRNSYAPNEKTMLGYKNSRTFVADDTLSRDNLKRMFSFAGYKILLIPSQHVLIMLFLYLKFKFHEALKGFKSLSDFTATKLLLSTKRLQNFKLLREICEINFKPFIDFLCAFS